MPTHFYSSNISHSAKVFVYLTRFFLYTTKKIRMKMFSLHHEINPHENVFFSLTARNEMLESVTSRFNNNTYYNA